jgi:aminoglycoside phosphotransferase (APT) family kinase protein
MERDLHSMRQALADYLPGGRRISEITPFSTGHANETYLLEGLGQILRLPPAAKPLLEGHGVIEQARIYEALGRTAAAPPVPKVVHTCSDAAVLGDRFFIMECAPGEALNDYVLQSWFTSATPQARDGICRQWLGAVASLALLAPLQELGPPVRPEEEVQRWQRLAAAAEDRALVEVFNRLLDLPAPCTGTASPVHGDPKLANLLWDQGRLTALLDWELAFNGEPLSDLGYILYYFARDTHAGSPASELPGMWSRTEVIDAWERIGSRSARGVEWYEMAANGKMAAILAWGFHLYESGQSTDVRFIRWKQLADKNTREMVLVLEDSAGFHRKLNG